MKLERMLGILTILQQRGKVTAPYLAERFEVSRRTISRDIDALCQAGIPVVTGQGAGGGISLAPGFALDTTVFTRDELARLLAGLGSVESISPGMAALREKLGGDQAEEGTLSIDLASFYRNDLADKIARLQLAIRARRLVAFTYYAPRGQETRCIEPVRIVYRWSAWYVQGYCRTRQDWRLFKLLRLWDMAVLEETFAPRELPQERKTLGAHMTDDYMITAVYEPHCACRLVEEYGPASFTRLTDGRLEARWGFTTREDALRWFLSFGRSVTVTAPEEFVALLQQEAEDIAAKYRGT